MAALTLRVVFSPSFRLFKIKTHLRNTMLLIQFYGIKRLSRNHVLRSIFTLSLSVDSISFSYDSNLKLLGLTLKEHCKIQNYKNAVWPYFLKLCSLLPPQKKETH